MTPGSAREARKTGPLGATAEPDEILEAFADLVGAGMAPIEALTAMKEIRGATARWTTKLAAEVRKGTGLAALLAQAEGMSAAESAFLGRADASGQLPAALRVLASRRRARRALRRDLLQASITPLAVLVLTLLTLPLPNLLLGGSYFRPLLGHVAIIIGGAVVAAVGVPRLLRHPAAGPRLVHLGTRLPLLANLIRLHAEATFAGALSALVADDGATPDVVATAALLVPRGAIADLLVAPEVRGRTEVPPGPLLGGVVSESFALALLTGREAGRLAERLGRFRDDAMASFAARVRVAVRGLAWGLVLVVSLEGVATLLSRPLPGFGAHGNLDGAGLEELERMLDGTK